MGLLQIIFGEPVVAFIATVCIAYGVTDIAAGLLKWHTVDGRLADETIISINTGTTFFLAGTILVGAPLHI
jgi:dolichyl-phosphate-mannose--protein O-mannosyl transferase